VVADPAASSGAEAADPKDEFLVALARVADVEALASGDPHLTELVDLDPPVATPSAWLAHVGLAMAERRARGAAEILWMAVTASRRGNRIGTSLLDQVLADLGSDGVHVVEAKTLDRVADYAPYVATRAFWERRGFVQIDTIDPLPGWQPGSGSAIYVAALAATR